MADYLVSADAGNGGTNVVIAKENGGYKSHYEASVRAMASGDTLGLGDLELQYTWIDWGGHRYVTGDDVVKVSRRGIEHHMGSSNRYGEEFHRFLVAVALAKMGIKEGTVDLTLFAPPGMFNEVKKKIERGFTGDNAHVMITLKGDKKPRQWHYEHVMVLPEGIGAALCFNFDDAGQPIQNDIFEGEVVVLDSGAFTLDAIRITDGNFNLDRLEEATIPNAGVHTHVREPMLRQIHKQGDDFKIVTVDDVDLAIRRGMNTGNWKLTVAGYEMDLEKLALRTFERYADWVSNNVCDGVFNGFRGVKSVILVGGGATMISDKLRETYPGKILDPKKFTHTKRVHPIDMNAVGGLSYALMRNRKHQTT